MPGLLAHRPDTTACCFPPHAEGCISVVVTGYEPDSLQPERRLLSCGFLTYGAIRLAELEQSESVRKLPGTQIEIRIKDFFKKSICITSFYGYAKYLGRFILQASRSEVKREISKNERRCEAWFSTISPGFVKRRG